MTLLICAGALGTLIGCGSRNARSSNIKKAEENMAAGMYQQAIPLLKQEINENPENPKAHFLLGKCNLAVGGMLEIAEAKVCFDRAKRLDPGLSKDVEGALVRCELAEQKIATARNDINSIISALDVFELDKGRWPTTKEDLQALHLEKGVPKDPWGNPYVYRCPGQHDVNGFDLYSFGPDGKEGGGDDIHN
jgi:general secretion pathway protein G